MMVRSKLSSAQLGAQLRRRLWRWRPPLGFKSFYSLGAFAHDVVYGIMRDMNAAVHARQEPTTNRRNSMCQYR